MLFILGIVINAQLKEVQELKKIEKQYDSILISYQKRAKDSLSALKKSERNEIMASEEAKIVERRKTEELLQLKKIKAKELELENLKLPEKFARCEMGENFQMPNLLNKVKYKPTVAKSKKGNSREGKKDLACVMVFQVTADGFIKNVNAIGENAEFNQELELTLYRLEKMTPRCLGGVSKTERYRLPVRMNFN